MEFIFDPKNLIINLKISYINMCRRCKCIIFLLKKLLK